jgi:hypothetical protein
MYDKDRGQSPNIKLLDGITLLLTGWAVPSRNLLTIQIQFQTFLPPRTNCNTLINGHVTMRKLLRANVLMILMSE